MPSIDATGSSGSRPVSSRPPRSSGRAWCVAANAWSPLLPDGSRCQWLSDRRVSVAASRASTRDQSPSCCPINSDCGSCRRRRRCRLVPPSSHILASPRSGPARRAATSAIVALAIPLPPPLPSALGQTYGTVFTAEATFRRCRGYAAPFVPASAFASMCSSRASRVSHRHNCQVSRPRSISRSNARPQLHDALACCTRTRRDISSRLPLLASSHALPIGPFGLS